MVSDRPTDPEAPVRRRAVFSLWLANLALGVLVGVNYLAHVPEVTSAKAWLFALAALVSSVLTLTILPGAIFYLAAHRIRSTSLLGGVQAGFWTLFQVLLFVDTRIYNIFRYHFNGQVLNLVYTRGSEDAVHLGWQVWSVIALFFCLFVWLQTWAWRVAVRRAQRFFERGARYALLRPSLVWSIILPTVFLEKTIYAQADLERDRQITHLARLFPLYARVPMEDLASRVLGVEPTVPPPPQLDGFQLDYPQALPVLPPDGPRPNILFLVIDCWRRDMLSPVETPRLWAWSRGGTRRFENHVSAGNSTRYGIFGLLYGLYGSYWFPVLEEGRSPVLLDVLQAEGYDFGIFGSASMDYPELRRTVWSKLPEAVHDQFPSPFAWRRDELAGEAFSRWLLERDGQTPFFAFLLLDSPHQTYSHPPDEAPFQPSAPELDYVAMTRNGGPAPEVLEAVRNRYRNALHHADRVAGEVLEAFDRSPLAENTIVIVTGDHGEEFLECGFFGHTSAFTPPQIEVPFVVRGPGFAPGSEEGPTSHLDVPSTLLELLGADPEIREHWCLGRNLLHPDPERRRVLSGWNELGVWTPRGIVRVPLSRLEFDLELYDYAWQLEPNDVEVLSAESATLEALGAACKRFLR